MNRWESIKQLISFCERLDAVHLHEQQKLAFLQKVLNSFNFVLITCVNVHTSTSTISFFVVHGVGYFADLSSNHWR